MPFASPADVPDSVKAFWKRVGASATAKRQWVNVFNSCFKRLGDEGRCIASANAVLNRRLGRNSHYTLDEALDASAITDTELDGKPAWQIPAIFTREGVQNRAFKPWKELRRAAWTLVDAPVVFPHPPHLDSALAHEGLIIGRIVSFLADEKSRSLRGNIAVFKSDPRSQWLVNALKQGFGTHGSVGFTFELDSTGGDFNSESFINIERDFFFDHFAVGLEYFGGKGACAPPMCGLLQRDEDDDMEDYTAPAPTGTGIEKNCEKARDILRAMNIFSDDAQIDVAAAMFEDELCNCGDCGTPEELMGIDEIVWKDQRYTFSPAWSEVDKSSLPSSAFLIVRDPEKKTTWKLPYKNPGGAINCNAVRAIVQVLGGARGGVDLTSEERASARRRSASMWRRCLAIRQRADSLTPVESDGEQVIYTADDINESEEEHMSSDEETKESEKLQAKVDELTQSLEEAKDKIEKFEADEKEREEATLSALREEVVSLAKDSEVFSDEELSEMDSTQLEVAKKFLGTKPSADHGIGGQTGGGKNEDDSGVEFLHGREYHKLTIGDLYEQPSMNPPLQKTNEGD